MLAQELQNEKARAEALSSALADSQANLQALRGELRKAHESMKELQMRQLDGRSTPAHSEDVRLSQGSFTEPTTPGSELQDGSSSRGANDPELQQLRKQVGIQNRFLDTECSKFCRIYGLPLWFGKGTPE